MTETTPATKRKIILINKAFQGRFIVSVLATIILFGLCSAALIYWLISSDLQVQSQAAHISISNTWERLGISILIGNIVAAVIAGLMTIFVVLYISHKIAGPLYRFETLCRQVGDGNLDIITHLRSNDQLHELAESFSGMVDNLRNKREEKNKLLLDMKNLLNEMKSEADLTEKQLKSLNKLELIVEKTKEV